MEGQRESAHCMHAWDPNAYYQQFEDVVKTNHQTLEPQGELSSIQQDVHDDVTLCASSAIAPKWFP